MTSQTRNAAGLCQCRGDIQRNHALACEDLRNPRQTDAPHSLSLAAAEQRWGVSLQI